MSDTPDIQEITPSNNTSLVTITNKLEKYRLDFSTLTKGNVVQSEYIEKMIGFTRDQPEYRFESMLLAKRVEQYFNALGKPITARIIKGDLCILTDEQALGYRQFRENKIVSRYVLNHLRTCEINRNELSEESKTTLDKSIRRQALGILALTGKKHLENS